MIKIIALDIDGTLLDSTGHVPPANRDAIARAIDAGIEVVLATGRRYDFARPVLDALPSPLTLLLSNGAVVKTCRGETLLRSLLPRDVAQRVLADVPEHRSSASLIFDRPREGQVVFERVDWDDPRHSRYFHANRPFITLVDPLEAALVEDPVQVMFTGRCGEMRAIYNRLQERGDCTVSLTEYEHRDFSLVDVVRAGCSKGAALRDWAASRGVEPSGIMAVGDNLNDLDMLEYAAHPVLVDNAIPELKARGWRVTASNDAAGVARAIETIVFGQAS